MIALFTEEEYEKLIRMIHAVSNNEFTSMSEEDLRFWIDFVKPMVSKKQFKDLYFQAIVLLICHKLKMAGEGENSLGELGKIGNSFVVKCFRRRFFHKFCRRRSRKPSNGCGIRHDGVWFAIFADSQDVRYSDPCVRGGINLCPVLMLYTGRR